MLPLTLWQHPQLLVSFTILGITSQSGQFLHREKWLANKTDSSTRRLTLADPLLIFGSTAPHLFFGFVDTAPLCINNSHVVGGICTPVDSMHHHLWGHTKSVTTYDHSTSSQKERLCSSDPWVSIHRLFYLLCGGL